MTPHLGLRLDGVHFEGNFLYLKVQWYKEKGGGVGGEEDKGRGKNILRRWREGGHNIGCDTTFSWSRALTHPSRCN